MRIHKIISFFLLLSSPLFALSQSSILEQDVNRDTVISDFGKNKARYFGSNFGFGSIVGALSTDSTGMELRPGISHMWHYGAYYKIRANNVYSILFHAAYQRSMYSFKVDTPEISRKLITNDVSFSVMNRFNFGKRGNYIGYYLSLGASADITFNNKFRIKSNASFDDSEFEFSKVSLHKLDYVNNFNYSAEARLGFNKLVVFGKYRLSEKLKKDKGYQLPLTTIGVMIDFGA